MRRPRAAPLASSRRRRHEDATMRALLVVMHCQPETGYAIGPLERAFLRVGTGLVGPDHVHFVYPGQDPVQAVREHGIDHVLGFDMPVQAPGLAAMRREGAKRVVAYWGAPMSSINRGPKL
ncbi:MAG TPA: hypothetical protein VFQ22_01660, partial [Longimicrobiales bacterium]|nr:hypothetical protein [Longimicrobiales bacterium]